MSFKEISAKDITDNVFKLIGLDWMLISAGNKESFNMMTASWGGLGILWNKPVAYTFIRPNRYTKTFVDANEHFALSFFSDAYKKQLTFCGRNSGKDVDKVKETGLTPLFDKAPYFKEARLILECKKLFASPFEEASFLDKDILKNYDLNLKDFHTLYIGSIEKVLTSD